MDNSSNLPLKPGATIAILGGGQLGSMLCAAAKQMGYRTLGVSNHESDPIARWADHHLVADPSDPATAARLARQVDVITVEAESINPDALGAAERAGARVAPGSQIQRVVRDRRLEKSFLANLKLPDGQRAVGDFRIAESADQATRGADELFAAGATKVVCKTAQGGYDGKGQRWLQDFRQASAAFTALGGVPLVLEAGITFSAEASVIVARSADDRLAHFPVFCNEHRRGILHQTLMPGGFSDPITRRAIELAEAVARQLNVVGLLAVEEFVLPDGRVLVNELAARPHNSGHVTLRAASRSQFEMHVAAICGLPLPEIEILCPGVMTNLLGDLWANGEPDFPAILADGRSTLHLYGKSPRAGRKMGHIIHTGRTLADALRATNSAYQLLGGR